MLNKAGIAASLGLDPRNFKRNWELMKEKVKRGATEMKRHAKTMSIAFGAAFAFASKAAIDLGSRISDLALQLKTGTTNFQTLKFATQEAGAGFSNLEKSLRQVNLITEEAINGNKLYKEAFERLNISLEDFRKLKTAEKLEALAIAQAKATDEAAAYNDVATILGKRAGPAMQEVLDRLADEGLRGIEVAARKAGQVMSEETIPKLDKAADKIEELKTRTTILTGEILVKAIPAFEILKNGLGFLGDVVGTAIINFNNFGRFLGSLISIAISPGQTAFEALSLSIQGVNAALDGEFKQAKALLVQSKDTFVDIGDDITAIPSRLGSAFSEFADATSKNFSDLGNDLEERAESIETAWSDMWGDLQENSTEVKNTIVSNNEEIETSQETVTKEVEKTGKSYKAAEQEAKAFAKAAEEAAQRARDAQRQLNNQSINSGYDSNLDAQYSAEYQRLINQGVSPERAQSLSVGNVNSRNRRTDGEGAGSAGTIGNGIRLRSGLTADANAQAANAAERARNTPQGRSALRSGHNTIRNPDGTFTSLTAAKPLVSVPGRKGVDERFAFNLAVRRFNEQNNQSVPIADSLESIPRIEQLINSLVDKLK